MGTASTANGGQGERRGSGLFGGPLRTLDLKRRAVRGAAMAIASGALLYRRLGWRRRPSRARGERPEAGTHARGIEVERSLTIGKSADELYRLFREPGTLARVMDGIVEVSEAGDGLLHWEVRGPLGRSSAWDTRFVEDRPGELLRWESLEGAVHQGSVRFRPAPGDWGTEVTLRIHFKPPAGALVEAAVMRLSSEPKHVLDRALRRFKSLAETGEIPSVEHNPSARRSAHVH